MKETIRAGYGELPRTSIITPYGRRLLKAAAGALAETVGKSVLFFTVTLPGRSQKAIETFARVSGAVVESVTKWIARRIPGCYWFYVWERHADGTLHLHLAAGSNRTALMNGVIDDFKQYCFEMYTRLSEKLNVDLFERLDGSTWKDSSFVLRCRAEWVEHDVRRYLSKYVSKQEGTGERLCPARWQGMSDNLRCLVTTLSERLVMVSKSRRLIQSTYRYLVDLARDGRYTSFEHNVPYDPGRCLLILYPPEEDTRSAYHLLCRLVRQAVTGISQSIAHPMPLSN